MPLRQAGSSTGDKGDQLTAGVRVIKKRTIAAIHVDRVRRESILKQEMSRRTRHLGRGGTDPRSMITACTSLAVGRTLIGIVKLAPYSEKKKLVSLRGSEEVMGWRTDVGRLAAKHRANERKERKVLR